MLINEAGDVTGNIFLQKNKKGIVDYIRENGRIIEIEQLVSHVISFNFHFAPFKIEYFYPKLKFTFHAASVTMVYRVKIFNLI
jgi:hypothetical protein